jgi:hypothetical protein
MAQNLENVKSKIFGFLRSNGYAPTMMGSSGKEIAIPEEADIFQFKFVRDGENYGTVTIGIDGTGVVTFYFGSSVARSPSGPAKDGSKSWKDLRAEIREICFSNAIRKIDVKDEDNLKYDMAKREHTKKLDEGYYAIGKKASYNDSVPSVKIKLQHTRDLAEGEQRYRNIARIYLENVDGERFLLNTKKPGIARVYARHIAEGGKVNDDRWNHINNIVEDYTKMAGFVRATRNGQFNESTQQLISEGVTHYQGLRETLHKLVGKKGYNNYFESWSPTLNEDTIGQTDLAERFMSSSLDPRIEEAMPILAKIANKINEMSEISELAEWTESIVDEALEPKNEIQVKQLAELFSQEIPVGVDGINAINLLGDNNLQSEELSSKLQDLSQDNPDIDARDAIVNWMNTSGDHLLRDVVNHIKRTETPQNPNEVQEGLDLGQGNAGQLGATDKVSTGKILGNKPQNQKGLRGKLVGATESIDHLNHIRKLSGLN